MGMLIHRFRNQARCYGPFHHICCWILLAISLSSAAQRDTLEIRLLKVQFAYEKTDNSLTTGRGHFDSDTGKSYSLDPSGSRSSALYWQQHVDFAADYYRKASGGKLEVVAEIFPRSKSAYELEKQIIDYNRTSRKKDEKLAEYDEARLRDYMSFIIDALTLASKDSEGSPFERPASPTRHVAYMIAHAGASRLVDGGSLGTNGADTPGDFLDVFVDKDFWPELAKNPDFQAYASGVVLGADTIRQVMVVSETASQDGLNWGINGIVVNQIGRQLGLPHTYDVVKGLSRLGYFDVMDIAGYNAGNGFFPVLPSAWLRAYMGWSPVREVRPGADGKVVVDIAAAGSGLGTEIVKVPITATEYLLIENRQRSHRADGNLTVRLMDRTETSVTLPADSLSTLFLDSICTAANACRPNSKKAKGVVLSSNAPDAALPGSGIAIWHINDWYLRESLPLGATNLWSDKTRDHHYGIALLEADGILGMGKQFQGALGQATYDYGSGADLLPHQRFGSGKSQNVVTALQASGYGNTASSQGASTAIRINAPVPQGAARESNYNAMMGDSVHNWKALTIPVTIEWQRYSVANGLWPLSLVSSSIPRGMVFVQLPSSDEKILVVGGSQGLIQYFSPRGDSLCTDPVITSDTSATVPGNGNPVCITGASPGPLTGMAASGQSVLSVHRGAGLFQTRFFPDGPGVTWTRDSLSWKRTPLAGPVLYKEKAWVADSSFLLSLNFSSGLYWTDSLAWPPDFVPQELAMCGDVDSDGESDVVAVGTRGQLAVRYSSSGKLTLLNAASGSDAVFRLVCSDFNRDGSPDAFVLGNSGSGWFTDLRQGRLLAPVRSYKRGADAAGKSVMETSAPVVADINNDGRPEAVFLGYNRVYAVDSSGLPLPGFPVTLSRGTPVASFLSDPLVMDVQGDGSLAVLIPGNEGSVYAVSSQGKLLDSGWPLAAGSFAYSESSSPMSIYAMAADSLKGPELYAVHREGIHGFSLPKANLPLAGWSLPGGNDARTNYFDADQLSVIPLVAPARETVDEFFVFPNPVRHGKASARFSLGAGAQEAVVEFFDIKGLRVHKVRMASPGRGQNQIESLQLQQLGSDVYSVRLTVRFESGKRVQKWDRVGVVR